MSKISDADLQTEYNADPRGLGYKPAEMSDEQLIELSNAALRDSLPAEQRQVFRSVVRSYELQSAVVFSDHASTERTDLQRSAWTDVLVAASVEGINPASESLRNLIAAIWGATPTLAAIEELYKRTGSSAEFAFGRKVNPQDLSQYRRAEAAAR